MISRRKFIQQSASAAAVLLMSPSIAGPRSASFPALRPLHEIIPDAVIIEKLSLVKVMGELFVKVTASNGITGVTMANSRMENLGSIFNRMVVPYFKGKDARDVAALVESIYKDDRNYKYAGMAFSNCVGHAEIAILDLLGKTTARPVRYLFGEQVREHVDVYLSSLTRETSAEEETEYLKRRLADTGAKAIKIKVGGRMKYDENSRQRTEKLVPMIRKVLGDSVTIYADGNGSFDVPTGVRVGKLLEDHGIAVFEEPCPWEDVEGNQKVAKALKLIVAGGEQDSSLYRWNFIARNNVYDLLQPDVYYNGGIIRLVQVARIANENGKSVGPHTPKADPLAAPFLQAAAVLPNLYGFQEYPANAGKQPSWYSPHILVREGRMEFPSGHGLGMMYDDGIWSREEVFQP